MKEEHKIELINPAKTNEKAIAYPSNISNHEKYHKKWRLAVILIPLCLGMLLVAIDNNIIAVAIPQITSTFKSLDQAA